MSNRKGKIRRSMDDGNTKQDEGKASLLRSQSQAHCRRLSRHSSNVKKSRKVRSESWRIYQTEKTCKQKSKLNIIWHAMEGQKS